MKCSSCKSRRENKFFIEGNSKCVVCMGLCKTCFKKIQQCQCAILKQTKNNNRKRKYRNSIKTKCKELKQDANEQEKCFIDEFFKMPSQGKLFAQVNNFYTAELMFQKG